MDLTLATLPASLQRLVLLGAPGLPAAWGPLVEGSGPVVWTFDANSGHALRPEPDADGGCIVSYQSVLDSPKRWTLPLDPESPWRARLAVVAAWVLGMDEGPAKGLEPYGAAILRMAHSDYLNLCGWWGTSSGGPRHAEVERWAGLLPRASDLPTLPQHLAAHPPEVALLLALWDAGVVQRRLKAGEDSRA